MNRTMNKHKTSLMIIIAQLFLVCILNACGSGSGVGASSATPMTTLQAILISPVNASLPMGMKTKYTATGFYVDGSQKDITASVKWISSNNSISSFSNDSVDNIGIAKANNLGTVSVIATTSNISSPISTLTVTNAILESITLSSANIKINIGKTLPIGAIGIFSDGSNMNITNNVNWVSDESMIASIESTTIESSAIISANRFGETYISANLSGITSSKSTIDVNDLLYVTGSNDNNIYGYMISPSTGNLTLLDNFPLATGGISPTYLTMNPSNSYLYTSNNGSISAFNINPNTGGLSPIYTQQFLMQESNVKAIVYSDQNLFISGGSTQTIMQYSVNSTNGKLSAVDSYPLNQPSAMAISESYLYISSLNSAGGVQIDSSQVKSATRLTLESAATLGGYALNSFFISNRVLYTTSIEQTRGDLFWFDILDGTVTAGKSGGGIYIESVTTPSSIVTTCNNQVLFTADSTSNSIDSYFINTDGSLTYATNTKSAASNQVKLVSIGSYLYILNSNTSNISGYSINCINGSLSPLTNSPFAVGINSIPKDMAIWN